MPGGYPQQIHNSTELSALMCDNEWQPPVHHTGAWVCPWLTVFNSNMPRLAHTADHRFILTLCHTHCLEPFWIDFQILMPVVKIVVKIVMINWAGV